MIQGRSHRDTSIKELLVSSAHIAVVGLSPKQDRPSNRVARYLIQLGYSVIPINPGQSEILGRTCYPDLIAVPDRVDIVNIFRNPDVVPSIVEQAVEIGSRAVWMQLGIRCDAAARSAEASGLFCVMDRCIKIEHERLCAR